jgi:hypothetical protein
MPSLENGLSPHDLFSKTRWEHRRFLDLHVWGCPVYVLDKTLSDGKKIPKWKPRSQRCIYVGLSKKHATSVPLVLNPITGAITAQFHVVFDDWFATIASSVEHLPDFNSHEWISMFGDSTFQYPFDAEEDTSLSDQPKPLLQTQRNQTFDALNNRLLPTALAPPPPREPILAIHPVESSNLQQREPPSADPVTQQREPPLQPREPLAHQREPPAQQREPSAPLISAVHSIDLYPPQRENHGLIDSFTPSFLPRHSTCQRQIPSCLGYDGSQGSGYVTEALLAAPDTSDHFANSYAIRMARTDSTFQPFCLVAHKDPDTLNWGEAMADTYHQDQWVAAA